MLMSIGSSSLIQWQRHYSFIGGQKNCKLLWSWFDRLSQRIILVKGFTCSANWLLNILNMVIAKKYWYTVDTVVPKRWNLDLWLRLIWGSGCCPCRCHCDNLDWDAWDVKQIQRFFQVNTSTCSRWVLCVIRIGTRLIGYPFYLLCHTTHIGFCWSHL